jgi:hypothetical protein
MRRYIRAKTEILDEAARIFRLGCATWWAKQRGQFDPDKHSRCAACEKAGCNYERTGKWCDCVCHALRGAALTTQPPR